MPVTNIRSEWVSGNLVFYEEAVGQSVTGDIFTLGTTAVKVGGTSQDVDFQFYATGSKSAIIDAGDGTLTLTGISASITKTGLNAASGRILKLDGSAVAPAHADGYGLFETNANFSGTVAGPYAAASSTWINFAESSVPGANICAVRNDGIYLPTGITASSATMVIGGRLQYVADDGANPGALHLWSTNIYSNALTSIFHVNALADFGGSTSAASLNGYKIPFIKDVTANKTWYINVYDG